MRKALLILVIALIAASSTFGADTFRYDNEVRNQRGDVIGGAYVTVYPADEDTVAWVYSGATTLYPRRSNPFTTDSIGRYYFYARPGAYDITISGTNVVTYTISDVSIAQGEYRTDTSAPELLWGEGAPDTSAVAGSIYQRSDSPAYGDSLLYLKRYGTGSDGWVPVQDKRYDQYCVENTNLGNVVVDDCDHVLFYNTQPTGVSEFTYSDPDDPPRMLTVHINEFNTQIVSDQGNIVTNNGTVISDPGTSAVFALANGTWLEVGRRVKDKGAYKTADDPGGDVNAPIAQNVQYSYNCNTDNVRLKLYVDATEPVVIGAYWELNGSGTEVAEGYSRSFAERQTITYDTGLSCSDSDTFRLWYTMADTAGNESLWAYAGGVLIETDDDPDISITGITGTCSDENNLVIAGVSFGAKSPAAPVVWDRIDNQSAYGTLSHGDQVPTQDDDGCSDCPWYSIHQAGAVFAPSLYGTTTSDSIWPRVDDVPYYWNVDRLSFELENMASAPSLWFFNWHFFYHKDFEDSPGIWESSHRGQSSKYIRLQPSYPDGWICDGGIVALPSSMMHAVDLDDDGYGDVYSNGSCSLPRWNGVHQPDDSWHQQEILYDVTNGSTADGTFVFRYDNTVRYVNDGVFASENSGILHMFGWDPVSASGSINVAYDFTFGLSHIYVDTTSSRVVVGDAPDYESCSIVEMQGPISWSDTSVMVTLSQGNFPDGSHGYLYVFNEYNMISNAYDFVWGQTYSGGTDVIPPSVSSYNAWAYENTSDNDTDLVSEYQLNEQADFVRQWRVLRGTWAPADTAANWLGISTTFNRDTLDTVVDWVDGDTFEVRVRFRDDAGNEGYSDYIGNHDWLTSTGIISGDTAVAVVDTMAYVFGNIHEGHEDWPFPDKVFSDSIFNFMVFETDSTQGWRDVLPPTVMYAHMDSLLPLDEQSDGTKSSAVPFFGFTLADTLSGYGDGITNAYFSFKLNEYGAADFSGADYFAAVLCTLSAVYEAEEEQGLGACFAYSDTANTAWSTHLSTPASPEELGYVTYLDGPLTTDTWYHMGMVTPLTSWYTDENEKGVIIALLSYDAEGTAQMFYPFNTGDPDVQYYLYVRCPELGDDSLRPVIGSGPRQRGHKIVPIN